MICVSEERSLIGSIMMEEVFMGSALCAVAPDGRLILPAFIRITLARRSNGPTILFGSHETDTCLVAHNPREVMALQEDCRRRRHAEEMSKPRAWHARARRIFGLLQPVTADGEGGCVLPEMLRRRARIRDSALLVGTGAGFEIWNPQVALYGSDAGLRAIAALSLETTQAA
jgi:DNA-binding transcriptional regulator/RsmH inhibitor MraZ